MKILQINNSLSWVGGVETYVLSLLPRLQVLGHEPLVLHAHGDVASGIRREVATELASTDRASERKSYQAVSRLVAAKRPDVIHMHMVNNIGALSACLDLVPTVLTTHGFNWICPAQDFFLERTQEVCEISCSPQCLPTTIVKKCMSLRPAAGWRSYRRASFAIRNSHRFRAVIGPCHYAAERHIRAGFPKELLRVLPYFCPVAPLEEPRPEPSAPMVTFLGRVRPYKGWRYFVDALSRLPGDVHGLIVGDTGGAAGAEIDALAKSTGCRDRLHTEPWVKRENLSDLFRRTSVFVFPSIWPETLGIVGLEALAHGVPVVASDIGGVREWLLDGQTGWLAQPKDADGLARGIQRLLDNKEQARQFGRNGIDLIKRSFSVEGHMAELLRIYAGEA